jgi:hypothetical protein
MLVRQETWQGGVLVDVQQVEEPVEDSNARTLRARAIAALSTNATYLAIANPTNAQVAAQVATVTKECSGIIRLLLNQLDTTAGT